MRQVSSILKLVSISILALTACRPGADVTPIQQPGGQNPPIQQPGQNPPGQQPQQPGETPPGRLLRIAWSGLDFQELTYDAQNRLARYTSQYVFVQGTNQVRTHAYDFAYDGTNRLQTVAAMLNGTPLSTTRYEYEGPRVSAAKEFSPTGELRATYAYRFSPDNKLAEYAETRYDLVGGVSLERKRTFEYDGRGNLTVERQYAKNAATGAFEFDFSTYFDGYDAWRHVENDLARTPFLPQVTFRVNNPGRRIIRGRDGQELSRERYTYAYDAEGFPVRKTVTGPGGNLEAVYTYVAGR